MKQIFSVIAGVLFFIAFMPYMWAIINHTTTPSPVSWIIWASVDTLALLAMKREKALNGQIIGATAGAWIVTVLAIYFGKPTMGMIEWISIVGAGAGIVLWQRTGKATLAIICAQIAVFLGAIPTIVGAYHNPAQENPVAWTIWLASCVCALVAVPKWDLPNALQPVNFTVIEVIMVFLVVVLPLF